MSDQADLMLVRELLEDSFGRIREGVHAIADGLSHEAATYRPDDQANSIAWLLWHLTRVQDDHVSELAGHAQVWASGGWYEQFGLPFDESATGYGDSSEDVAEVAVSAQQLDDYQAQVHERCVAYVASLTATELERVVDESWDPPVTAAARLVSVVNDCAQHVGQAAYVRGLATRLGM